MNPVSRLANRASNAWTTLQARALPPASPLPFQAPHHNDNIERIRFTVPGPPKPKGCGVMQALKRAMIWGAIGGVVGAMPLIGLASSVGSGAIAGAITDKSIWRRLAGMSIGASVGYAAIMAPSLALSVAATHFFLPAVALFGAATWGYTAYQVSRHEKQAMYAMGTVASTCLGAALLLHGLGHNRFVPDNLRSWAEFVAPAAPITLSGTDDKKAAFIDNYLARQNSPAAADNTGALMVHWGEEWNVDPMVLLAIAGQETQFGKAGIGKDGMLGVGAYDNDPRNATRNPLFSGVERQVRVGAQTFAHLREKGGCDDKSPLADQLAAVNKAGWASDPNWHTGVAHHYRQIMLASR